jgi:hypothetical protein
MTSRNRTGVQRSLSEVRCTTSRWPSRGAMNSRITSWATWCQLSAVGLLCRRRAARPGTTTATEAGRSVRSGVPATGGTRRGAAVAAQCFTRRSPARTAEPAIGARCRCTKTSNVIGPTRVAEAHTIAAMSRPMRWIAIEHVGSNVARSRRSHRNATSISPRRMRAGWPRSRAVTPTWC